ncbi:methyltransferase regulatory domain-containing protein [Pseudenhygromyxa sp. WMMC2535]|uniref:methyltransferase regulatory domain-containing protein n=1 Tax=Pseudenhygromyxa sp. WMMC2535 TaxID=2712867 RepID=UPI0015541A1B|nr:class I SAM-dependent methyltransferase [Pseudenhygromyxa sp. WMMC2535]NVB39013.1 methyltransferase regulatory domain-containing protein [Pseudenhygromyxa sp. WMMC2535]
MAPQPPPADSYAELPYPSYCHPLTGVDGLCARGRLFGLATAPTARCRVLELGCASGGNLFPLAELWPDSRFVGVDRSQTQISAARELAATLGSRNIEFLAADILDLDPEALGRFDYVLCHGVWSWVPEPVRARILAMLPELLRPAGLAVISYNVYPGWHMREVVRGLMVERSRGLASAGAQVVRAREAVELVHASIAARRAHIGAEAPSVYEQAFAREREVVRRLPDAFLAHEHLEQDNTPVRFCEFAERAQAAGLAYVGDAELDTMVARDLPPDTLAALQAAAEDRVGFEQLLDFVRNRELRHSILCRRDANPRAEIDPAALETLRFAQHSRPLVEISAATLRPETAVVFPLHGSDDERAGIRVSDPLTKAALVELCARWPASVELPALERGARERLAQAGLELEGDPAQHRAQLCASLLECLLRRALSVRVCEPPLARSLTRPRVGAFNREMAARTGWVAGLDHQPFMLDPTLRHLVPLLDGRERPALLTALRELVARGALVPRRDGVPVLDGPQLDAALESFLQASSTSLARLPVLVSPPPVESAGGE